MDKFTHRDPQSFNRDPNIEVGFLRQCPKCGERMRTTHTIDRGAQVDRYRRCPCGWRQRTEERVKVSFRG